MSWITLILANLPAEIQGVTAIINYISSLRTAAKQAGIWSDVDETAFVKLLITSFGLPQWMTDAEKAQAALPKV